MKKILLGVFSLSLALIISSCNKEDVNTNQDDKNQTEEIDISNTSGEIVPGQYVVVLKQSSKKSLLNVNYSERVLLMKEEAAEMMANHNISTEAVHHAYNSALRGFSAKLNDDELSRLKKDDKIAYILADRVFILKKPAPEPPAEEAIPYGIIRVGYGDGTGKTAWIIDSGIDYDHPDLNVDVARAANFTRASSADDDNGHGSHCAGTVAAINNDIGVVGVAAGANVVPVKVLDRRGSGYYSWIIAGIDYVAANASPGDAVNMSLGGSTYQPIDDAVLAASENGIFFALAAGNESDDANNHSPARVNGQYIWTISAMDVNDDFAYFSNYGNPPIDFCMPGVSVYSTYKSGGYATLSGTSMAAPHMCGVLLMTGGNPSTDGNVNGDPDGNPDPIAHL